MTANQLLFNSQKFFVESDLSPNDTIEYIYSDTNEKVKDLHVFINHITDNEKTTNTNLSKATLANVILANPPEQNDSVKLPNDSRWWKVQEWRRINDMYMIEITANRSRI